MFKLFLHNLNNLLTNLEQSVIRQVDKQKVGPYGETPKIEFPKTDDLVLVIQLRGFCYEGGTSHESGKIL